MNKVKLLIILPSLKQSNGISSYVMNYYRNIKNIEIDFLITNSSQKSKYYDEILKNNKIFDLSYYDCKNFFEWFKKVKEFSRYRLKEYDAIHCQAFNSGIPFLYYAKKYGVKTRILHSHATISSDNFLNRIRNDILARFAINLATDYWACSKAAGRSLFKKRKFDVINNAINIDKFLYNKEIRNKIRKKENIKENEILIGSVGRFENQKNQIFLLKTFKKIFQINKNVKLCLIGSGSLKNDLIDYAKQEKIDDVFFIKEDINNVNEYYQAFDLFFLPSLYEGLPIVGIEAQLSGVKCVFSNTITDEVKISDLTEFLPITSSDKWLEVIKNFKKYDRKNYNLNYDKFNIVSESLNVEKKYLELVKRNER